MRRHSGHGLTLALALFGALNPGMARSEDGFSAQPVGMALSLKGEDPRLGGFSGIEVTPDGARFILLSDRARVIAGAFMRDENGNLAAIEPGPIIALRGTDGGAMPRFYDDAEGTALMPDGSLCISFEGVARIWCYDRLDGPTRALPAPPGVQQMLPNASFEALAVSPVGTLWTVPERPPKKGRDFPVLTFAGGTWSHPFDLPRADLFLPVGADFGPDGALYLLERQLGPLGGFASRVRRFEPAPSGLGQGETLWQSPLWRHGNLEGIAAWQDPQERIRLVLVGDDNFNFFQASELIELVIEPPLAPNAPDR